MSDISIFLYINGLSGKVPALDGLFKGLSNDYFSLITLSLVLIWLWFATRNNLERLNNQHAIIAAVISIAVVSSLVLLCNSIYVRPRPFEVLPSDSLNLLFYRPTDSSFPSNLAAVSFAVAVSIFIKNRTYGCLLLGLAALSSFGRVYLGIHYPLDIIGGAVIGTISSFIAYGIARLLKPVIDYALDMLQRESLA